MEKGVVEKCLQKISDPFTLVVLASYRSQELASGATPCVPTEGSKDALVALKEISTGDLDMGSLEDRMITSLQKFAFLSEEGLLQPAPVERKRHSDTADIHSLFQGPKTDTGINHNAPVLNTLFKDLHEDLEKPSYTLMGDDATEDEDEESQEASPDQDETDEDDPEHEEEMDHDEMDEDDPESEEESEQEDDLK
jgi:DNA-directed RNA polymerase subunit omega